MTNELSNKIAKWSARKALNTIEKTRITYSRKIPVYPGDNWCPNFEGNKVDCSLYILFEENIYSKVSIWGNDDTGVIREFGDDIGKAIDMYLKIASNTCPSWESLIKPNGKWKFKND